jgi:hypothetical protein
MILSYMTKTLSSLAHREHRVVCTTHELVAIVPSEALAIWMAGDHIGKFPECSGKVTYYPTKRLTPEGKPLPKEGEGGVSGEVK